MERLHDTSESIWRQTCNKDFDFGRLHLPSDEFEPKPNSCAQSLGVLREVFATPLSPTAAKTRKSLVQSLRENRLHHVSMHVREAEIAAGVPKRKLLVV